MVARMKPSTALRMTRAVLFRLHAVADVEGGEVHLPGLESM